MNTIQVNSPFPTTSLHGTGTLPLAPFSNVAKGLRRAATKIIHLADRRSAIADEKARQSALTNYHRSMASLAFGRNQFDSRRDDIFARTDS